VTPPRRFTVDDANAVIPRLRALVERLQRSAWILERERAAWAAAHDGADVAADVLVRERADARRAAEDLDAVVAEFERLGVQLKDIELGLVDFPSEQAGRSVLLCWQYGEPEVAFWHGTDEGFAARRSLGGSRLRPTIQ
jgi:hypothetical protein